MKIGIVSEKPDVRDDARFTIEQSAALLGVHYNTINNWIRRGLLKPREWMYRKIDNRRYVTGRAIKRIWQEVY